MKKHFLIFTLLLAIFLQTGCSYGIMQGFYRKMPVEDRAQQLLQITPPFTIPSDQNYSFIVIGDLHFGAPKKADTQAFINQIAEMDPRPTFCISVGDATERGVEKEYDDYIEIIVQPLEDLGIQTFNIVGNHDLYNHGWDYYARTCYPYTSFYKFVINDLSYYFIDTASGNLSKPQMPIFKEAIENDPNRKIICSHVPLYAEDVTYFVMQDTQERNELISLFEKNNVEYYIGGHFHFFRLTTYNNFQEINIPAFLDLGGWGVFNVNQTKQTITFEPLLHQISAS